MTAIPRSITSTARSAQGELIALVGPNGAGKSTLLKGIMGELKPLDGRIDLHGLSHRDIAYLPQQVDIDRSFPITVLDCVAMGLWREIGALARSRCARASARSPRLSRRSAFSISANRPIGALSGGQFQRVLFARLMLQDCRADPARRAVPRRRREDRRRPHPARSGAGTRRAAP